MTKAPYKTLIKAAKEYIEYQSIGNGAKLNCAIERAEKDVKSQLKPQEGETYPKPLDVYSKANEMNAGEFIGWWLKKYANYSTPKGITNKQNN